jgi:hypothetical protein
MADLCFIYWQGKMLIHKKTVKIFIAISIGLFMVWFYLMLMELFEYIVTGG